MSEVLHGPLEERHRQLGASFAEFSGWLMPVSYAGTVSEHTATRTTVGLFDVSHLGKALVRGPGAAEYVNSALTNDLRPHRAGQGAIHVVLHRFRWRHRRPDRLLRLRRRDLPGAQRRQHSRRRGGAAGARTRGPDDHRRTPLVRGARRAGTRNRPKSSAAWACRPTWTTWDTRTPSSAARKCGCAAPATPASTGTNCCRRGIGPAWFLTHSSTPSAVPAVSWRGWAPATRCAPKWVIRCTATNCHWTSRRCRRAAGGRSGGRRTRSGDAMRCWRRRRRARSGCCAGCGRSAAGCCGPTSRCSTVTPRSV